MSATPQLVGKIAAEIASAGVISFARYMELALYCPECGYYEKEEDRVGRRGDFYTSPSVGSLFGQMLAAQFSDWARLWGEQLPLGLVEAGAHRGALAYDVLEWFERHRPAQFQHLQYWLVEPSARRREWQAGTLSRFRDQARWVADVGELKDAAAPVRNNMVIFCNELLDSMPVHRFGWDAAKRAWFEWGVTMENGGLAWKPVGEWQSRRGTTDEPGETVMNQLASGVPPELEAVLPNGFIWETCPSAVKWWREAAGVLGRGKLLALDYGLAAHERFMPERPDGTLRAYYRHHVTGDILGNPGEQDITAHVDFTALQAAGEAAGLATEVFSTQAQFLAGILKQILAGTLEFAAWDAKQARQFQTLTHPEYLGLAFRVLVQSR